MALFEQEAGICDQHLLSIRVCLVLELVDIHKCEPKLYSTAALPYGSQRVQDVEAELVLSRTIRAMDRAMDKG